MIQDEIIGMLKTALDKANAPNASASDFDEALLDLVCVNKLVKNNVVHVDEIFSALEAEIKTFLNSPLFLKRTKSNTLPTSDGRSIIEINTDSLLPQLHTLPPLYLKIDFGSIDIPSQD